MREEGSLYVPGEFELTRFFEGPPIERAPEDGYWCFASQDARGIKLRFSFNVFERSIQTVLSLDQDVLESVSHEHADALQIDGGELRATFTGRDEKTLLVVRVSPAITVKWSTLLTG